MAWKKMSDLWIVVFFGAMLFLKTMFSVMSFITRDAIFVTHFGKDYLSILILVLAVVTFPVTAAFQYFLRRYNAVDVALGNALIATCVFAFLYNYLESSRMVAFSVYVFVDVFVQLIMLNYWEVAGAVFDTQQQKKYYSWIGFGNTLGTLFVGFVVVPYLKKLPSTSNLAVLTGMCAAMVLLLSIARLIPTQKSSKPLISAKTPVSGPSVYSLIKSKSFHRYLCFFELCATVAKVLIDLQMVTILSSLDESEVKSNLGFIKGLQAVAMVPLQFFTSVFVARAGVVSAVMARPFMMIVLGTVTFVYPDISYLVIIRGLYDASVYTLFGTASKLLYLPVSNHERTAVKPFLNGPFRGISRCLGAVLSSVLALFLSSARWVSVPMCVMAGMWLLAAQLFKRTYVAEFYSSLDRRSLDFNEHTVNAADPAMRSVISATLSDTRHPHRQAFLLRVLPADNMKTLKKEMRVAYLAGGESEERDRLRRSILEMIIKCPQDSCLSKQDLMMLVNDESASELIRSVAMVALGHLCSSADEDVVQALEERVRSTEEPSSVLSTAAAIALLKLTQWMDTDSHLVLQSVLRVATETTAKTSITIDTPRGESEREHWVAASLDLIGKHSPELLSDGYLVYLLNKARGAILKKAVDICAQRNAQILVPSLVSHLTSPALRTLAANTLQCYSPAVVRACIINRIEKEMALKNTGALDAELIHGCVRTLAHFPSDSALCCLFDVLDKCSACSPDPDRLPNRVVDEVADSILAIVHESRPANLDARVSELVNRGVDYAYLQAYVMFCLQHELGIQNVSSWDAIRSSRSDATPKGGKRSAMSLVVPPEEGTQPLLLQYLATAQTQLISLLLKLCATSFPAQFKVHLILEALGSTDKALKSAVVEVLDNLVPIQYRSKLMPLINGSLQDVTTIARTTYSLPEHSEMLRKQLCSWICSGDDLLSLLSFTFVCEQSLVNLLEGLDWQHQNIVHSKKLQLAIAREIKDNVQLRTLLGGNIPRTPTQDEHSLGVVDITKALKRSSFFEHVGIREIMERIVPAISVQHVQVGSRVVTEGDIGTGMHVIVDGSLRVVVNGVEERTLTSGACFGEMSLLLRGDLKRRTATVVAETFAVLLTLDSVTFDSLLTSHSVTRGIVKSLLAKFQYMNEEYVRIRKEEDESIVESPPNYLEIPPLVSQSSFKALQDMKGGPVSPIGTPQVKESSEFEGYSVLEKCVFIAATPLFRDLEPRVVNGLALLAQEQSFCAQETIFNEGSAGDSMILIIHGTVSVHSHGVQVATRGEGECVGEIALLLGSTRTASVIAEEDTTVLTLQRDAFFDFSIDYISVMHAMLTFLSERLLDRSQQVAKISKSVYRALFSGDQPRSALDPTSPAMMHQVLAKQHTPQPKAPTLSPVPAARFRKPHCIDESA